MYTGYLDVWVPSTIRSYSVELSGRIRLYGVRFWPDGDAFKAMPHGEEAQTEISDAKPPISDADLTRWFEVFSKVHEVSTEDMALRSAQAMYLDKNVSRQKIRDLRGPQKRGKPPNRDK